MFINTSTKEFTLVNNAIPSYDIAFEHLIDQRSGDEDGVQYSSVHCDDKTKGCLLMTEMF